MSETVQALNFAPSASISQAGSSSWLSATGVHSMTLQNVLVSYLVRDSDEALREIGAVISLYHLPSSVSSPRVSTNWSDLVSLIHGRINTHVSSLGLLSEPDVPALPGGSDPQPVNEELLKRLRGTTSREGTDVYAWYAQMNDDWE